MKWLVVQDAEFRLENPPKNRLSMLSPREREWLRVLARGLSLKEAASVLGITYKTADKQKASIMAKLDIHDCVELARYAIREGLVEPSLGPIHSSSLFILVITALLGRRGVRLCRFGFQFLAYSADIFLFRNAQYQYNFFEVKISFYRLRKRRGARPVLRAVRYHIRDL